MGLGTHWQRSTLALAARQYGVRSGIYALPQYLGLPPDIYPEGMACMALQTGLAAKFGLGSSMDTKCIFLKTTVTPTVTP